MNQLTETESTLLESCLDTILEGLESESAAQLETGNALRTVRDGKLYRQAHKTFDEWVEANTNLKRTRAYQLIDHADVVSEMSTRVDKSNVIHLPANEAQTRVLKNVDPEKRQEVFEKAFEKRKGQPTAKEIAEVAEQNKVIQKGLKKMTFGQKLDHFRTEFHKLLAACEPGDISDIDSVREELMSMTDEVEVVYQPIKAEYDRKHSKSKAA